MNLFEGLCKNPQFTFFGSDGGVTGCSTDYEFDVGNGIIKYMSTRNYSNSNEPYNNWNVRASGRDYSRSLEIDYSNKAPDSTIEGSLYGR